MIWELGREIRGVFRLVHFWLIVLFCKDVRYTSFGRKCDDPNNSARFRDCCCYGCPRMKGGK